MIALTFLATLVNYLDRQTLPVAMYNYVREYADPTMAAMRFAR